MSSRDLHNTPTTPPVVLELQHFATVFSHVTDAPALSVIPGGVVYYSQCEPLLYSSYYYCMVHDTALAEPSQSIQPPKFYVHGSPTTLRVRGPFNEGG